MKNEVKKITRRTFLKTGLVMGGAAAAGIPTFSLRTVNAQPKEVKVGLLAPLTGVSANWGQNTYNGFQLAAQLLSEEGGIRSMGGAKVSVIVADTESKPEVAAIQAEKLVADKDILMLSGSNQSAASMLATQVAERSHICYVTGVDGAPQITERGFQYTYRTNPIMTHYARDFVYFARDMGKKTGKVVKKMAILCENSIFGVSGGDAAAKYGKEVGFEVVDYSTYDATTTRDFTGYISKYKSAGVELLVCHSRPQDSFTITRTMKELNFNPYGYGGVAGHHPLLDFAKSLGKDSNYVIASNSFTGLAKIPRLQEILARYEKQFHLPADALMSYGFAVLAVMKAALEKSPTYDREKFKQALDKVEIKTGENNNLQIDGVKWAPNHDNALAQVFVIQWKDGVDIPVAPPKYAVKEGVWPRPTWDEISKEK